MILIQACEFALPETIIPVSTLLETDRTRLEQLSASLRFYPNLGRTFGAGIQSVRRYNSGHEISSHVSELVTRLLIGSSLPAPVDLVVDFSTVPHGNETWGTYVCDDLKSETCRAISITGGGCANFHMALWSIERMLASDSSLQQVLLISVDQVPDRARVLFPLTFLGDGASGWLINRNRPGWQVLGTRLVTAAHLRDAVGLPTRADQPIPVSVSLIETRLLPIHFKAIDRSIRSLLDEHSMTIDDVNWYIYPCMSSGDRSSFCRAFRVPETKLAGGRMQDAGHVFATDMAIQFKTLNRVEHAPGTTVMLISAGAGFHWGCTLLRRSDGSMGGTPARQMEIVM